MTGKKPKKQKPHDPETGEILTVDSPKTDAREANCRRARNELRRTILANFDNGSKFVTLTFAENLTDVNQANAQFKRFIQRMRRRHGDFKYAAVIEFQERGAVHYHMISDLPYIPKPKLADIWGHGFVRINEISHVDNVGAYITAYMTKDNLDDRLRGKKAYMTSKNLLRPITLQGMDAQEIIDQYADKKNEVYANSYESEYLGLVSYAEHNMYRESVTQNEDKDNASPMGN